MTNETCEAAAAVATKCDQGHKGDSMSRTLAEIASEHPRLTFQNDGYQYIDKQTLHEADHKALDEIREILTAKVEGFVKFFNFKRREDGSLVARFDYVWDPDGIGFIGVGYVPVEKIDKEDE